MSEQNDTYRYTSAATQELTQAQEERERISAQVGADRFDMGLESMAARDEHLGASPIKRLLQNALPATAEHLEKELARLRDGLRNGQRIAELNLIERSGLFQCAYIGLNMAFGHWDRTNYLNIAVRIADIIQMEALHNGLESDDPKLYTRLFGDRVDPKKKVRNRSKFKREAGKLDEGSRLRIGSVILNSVFYTDIFFPEKKWDTKNKTEVTHLSLDEEILEWLKENNELERWMRPMFSPMVVSPTPWKGAAEEHGPYLLPETNLRTPLVRRAYDPKMQQMLKVAGDEGTMREALDALNAIQATPYRINKRVLEAIDWAWKLDLGGEINKLPKASLVDEVPKPEDFEALSKEQQISYLRDSAAVRAANDAVRTGVSSFSKDISEAKDLAEYGRFWLPHNLDFRGRVYPIPHFNHQREDYVSALLEFADGKALGPRGAYWLALHIVGCGEFDGAHKRKLEDRWLWVQSNSDLLCSYARDPFGNTGWILAEKPFKFLAACFEWEGYVKRGNSFISHQPIALDGSNSGLQHYAAALRSSQDARLVNLHDLPDPQDVYAAVSSRVYDSVKEDAERPATAQLEHNDGSRHTGEAGERLFAKMWLAHGVDRKTVKRQVMTYGYSSEEYGFKDQLMADLMRPLTTQVLHGQIDAHPFEDYTTQFGAVGYLAKKIWIAIHEVVVSAATGMSWFKHVARLLSQEGKCVYWMTPVGFPVVHKYNTYDNKRFNIKVYDRHVTIPNVAKQDDYDEDDGRVWKNHSFLMRSSVLPKLNARKQKSAVSPNVIHSMDAAHLMRIVLHALEEGMRDFSMIHDSFATHAGDTERFFWLIREAMVKMYEDYDIFQVLYDEAWEQLSEEGRQRLLPPPAKGDFDIRTILRSTYSFC